MAIPKKWLVALILIVFHSVFFLNSAAGQKVHVLVASDQSEWAGWGEHVTNIFLDATLTACAFENNIPEKQLHLERFTIEMEPGSPDSILRQLERFQINTNDTFVFYFSGHGAADNRGHYLKLEKGNLYRSKIKEVMAAKHPRLAIILTDCCNVRSDKFEHFAPYIESIPPQSISPLFRSLLIEPSGWIDVNGSSPGESAYFFQRDEYGQAKGSLFTMTLLEYLENNRQQATSWQQLLDRVSIQVYESFRQNYPNGIASNLKGKSGQRQTRQYSQHVQVIDYPGMPEKQGPRTGITVRDHLGTGAVIVEVLPNLPGARVFDLANKKYVSLQPNQVVVAANGQAVATAQNLFDIVRASPQVLRLTISDPTTGTKDYLMKLRY